ncbi:hypothetical protein OPQ81_000875 [Rhizoctonia solani]|nr:hypothetical protein OPQ81_000875 [Rhizoctonia solani]
MLSLDSTTFNSLLCDPLILPIDCYHPSRLQIILHSVAESVSHGRSLAPAFSCRKCHRYVFVKWFSGTCVMLGSYVYAIVSFSQTSV